MKQYTRFHRVPSFFKSIFKPTRSWTDQCGTKVLICDDKPMTFEFGYSEVWNGSELVWTAHPNEMWMRIDEDYKIPHRTVDMFKPSFADKMPSEFVDVPLVEQPRPILKRKLMDHIHEVIQLMPNKAELIEYYADANVAETYESKDDAPPKPSEMTPTRAWTKMIRRREIKRGVVEKKAVTLTALIISHTLNWDQMLPIYHRTPIKLRISMMMHSPSHSHVCPMMMVIIIIADIGDDLGGGDMCS